MAWSSTLSSLLTAWLCVFSTEQWSWQLHVGWEMCCSHLHQLYPHSQLTSPISGWACYWLFDFIYFWLKSKVLAGYFTAQISVLSLPLHISSSLILKRWIVHLYSLPLHKNWSLNTSDTGFAILLWWRHEIIGSTNVVKLLSSDYQVLSSYMLRKK